MIREVARDIKYNLCTHQYIGYNLTDTIYRVHFNCPRYRL